MRTKARKTARTSRQADSTIPKKKACNAAGLFFHGGLFARAGCCLRMVMMHPVLSMFASMAAPVIATHMPMFTCCGLLHLRLAARTRCRLAASHVLRAALDFSHPRRIGAFTNAALRRLRERSGGAKQQRQYYDRHPGHFHGDLSLTIDGLLSDKS